MKKLLLMNICLLSVLGLSFGAHAQGQGDAHRAFVFEGDMCWYYSPETGELVGNRFHAVGQYAGGPWPGNGKATCRGVHDLDLNKPLVVRDGPCNAFGFLTEDTLLVATPGGQWTFQCNFPKAE